MAYTAGDTILDDEYNTFVNNSSSPFGLNHFAATGSTVYGLGESAVSTVAAGNTITASQWNSLFTGIDTVAAHTGDTMTSRAAVSAGDTIAIKAAVAADLATLAASVAAGCPNTTAVTTSSTLQTSSSSSTWNGSFTTEFTITFSSADNMRFFFNAGGKVRVSGAVTGTGEAGDGSGSVSDDFWANLYSALGNLDIKSGASTRSGSGETLDTDGLALGFYDLTTAYQTIIGLSDDTYPYGSNTLVVRAKLNAAPGSSTVMTVEIKATDGTTNYTFDPSNPSGSDTNPYRNGTNQHYLVTVNTTTGGGLANAYSPSATANPTSSTT